MKVFIENEADSNIKNLFNEETLEYRKSVEVSANYPFPYGFLLNTKSGDGDSLDCFVLTNKPLKSREIVEVEPIGMFEEIENDEEDHKILAVPVGDSWTIDVGLENVFKDFSAKVFSHIPGKKKVLGRFLGKEDALRLIQKSKGAKGIRTKLGELVSSENEENWWRTELFEKNTRKHIPSELEIITPPPEEGLNYNCFVYVLGFQNDQQFLGNAGWEFTRNLGLVFDEMISKNILKHSDTPKKGLLILYRTDDGVISHVGLMENEKNVISKWSWGPLIKHEVFDVPDHYGNKVEFYTLTKEAIDFVTAKRSNSAT